MTGRLCTFLGVFALVGCGPSGPPVTREGAATAVYDSSRPGSSQSGLGSGDQVSGSCSNAGSANVVGVRQIVDVTGGMNITQEVQVELRGCSSDGRVFRDGRISVAQRVGVGSTATTVLQQIEGSMTLSGDVSDKLDFAVTQSVGVVETASTNVSVTFDGHIQSTTENFVFSNELLTITPGQL